MVQCFKLNAASGIDDGDADATAGDGEVVTNAQAGRQVDSKQMDKEAS